MQVYRGHSCIMESQVLQDSVKAASEPWLDRLLCLLSAFQAIKTKRGSWKRSLSGMISSMAMHKQNAILLSVSMYAFDSPVPAQWKAHKQVIMPGSTRAYMGMQKLAWREGAFPCACSLLLKPTRVEHGPALHRWLHFLSLLT